MMWRILLPVTLLLHMPVTLLKSCRSLLLENLALRPQLLVLTQNPSRPRLDLLARAFWEWSVITVSPSGFLWSLAMLASSLLEAMPMVTVNFRSDRRKTRYLNSKTAPNCLLESQNGNPACSWPAFEV